MSSPLSSIFNPPPTQGWQPLTPTKSLEELILELIDTRELEERYEFCKLHIEYGFIDLYRALIYFMSDGPSSGGGPLPQQLQNIMDKLKRVEDDYNRLEIQIREAHSQNHRTAVEGGVGYVSNDGRAYNSYFGTTHHTGNDWSFHHNPNPYGQPGYPQNPHPSWGQIGWGLLGRAAGVPPTRPY